MMKFTRVSRSEPGFQMAPMIDIVFLLIIFFMCATTFHQLESVQDVSLPVAEHSQTMKKAPGTVVININSDGAIILNQKIYEPDKLAKVLAQGSVYGTAQSVIIRADKSVPHGRTVQVLSACAAAGIWDVSFSTYKEEPRK